MIALQGVFGQLKLHGVCPASLWTKLGATAGVGATQLTLATAVNGLWLDREIVITTTSKEGGSDVPVGPLAPHTEVPLTPCQ